MDKTVQRFGNLTSKNRVINQIQWRFLLLPYLFFISISLFGEGSVNFIDYDGLRLFYSANEQQQLKVYATVGEYINVGSSHVGITGGFIKVYRPDGTLHTTFDNNGETAGLAIIYNDVEEKNGPTGGGLTMNGGYIPGVIGVEAGEEGIWTVTLEFPNPTILVFQNLHNSAPWTRANDQPDIERGVLAWDITVSQGQSGNQGGALLSGRVYSNEYLSVVSRNGNMTSPKYNILTKDGFIYKVDFMDTDPWNFPLFSNSVGLVKGDGNPSYRSLRVQDIIRSAQTGNWINSQFYLYEPQAEDNGAYVNNKIFFSNPSQDMPSTALTTDIFRNNTHTTWLYTTPSEEAVIIDELMFTGQNALLETACVLSDSIDEEGVAYMAFRNNVAGTAILHLDLNGDGDYDDMIDRDIFKFAEEGGDTIRWDGLDGMGNEFTFSDGFTLNYQLEIRGGEMHVLMSDVENNFGGVIFELLNSPSATSNNNIFYYDHSLIGQATDVSGGGTPGNPQPTTIPFTYVNNYGNEKMLDYWTFMDYGKEGVVVFDVNTVAECDYGIDSDGDGVDNDEDLDDDNDGVPDRLEFCTNQNGFDCLPNQLDPSGDEDIDGVANFEDANDEAVGLSCTDNNEDGICDNIPFQYDLDGDGVPNHLDLDSDNDGITDLIEAGHAQVDSDGNGIIDGSIADFGLNGFYNAIASDADAFSAVATYVPQNKDEDALPDYQDLDSDNDGINDVEEAGFGEQDINNNGRLIASNNLDTRGLSPVIAPSVTGLPIPLPLDTDGDSWSDYQDLDSDNDGINDVQEGGKTDEDNNGIIGVGTPQINSNGQAMEDANGTPLLTTSLPVATDADDMADYRDLDSDNDGFNDTAEAGFLDNDNDGIVGNTSMTINANGQPVFNNLTSISNPLDKDNDGIANYRDLDSDNDGINDVEETGNGFTDSDNDGVIGIGVPTVNANGQAIADMSGVMLSVTSQIRDTDNDDVADYNDLDTDNDGIYDIEEAGFDDADLDENGIMGTGMPTINSLGQPVVIVNNVETTSTSKPKQTDFDQIPDYQDLDTDNDGINDVAESMGMDMDDDGIIGTGTPVVNADGVVIEDANGTAVTSTSSPQDKDNDGVKDYRDLDSDNDGINDVAENGGADPENDGIIGTGVPMVNALGQAIDNDNNSIVATSTLIDTDSDSVPDFYDLDSDNDAINDVIEGGSFDEDNDGIAGTGIPFVNDNGQPLISGGGELITVSSNPIDTDEDGTPDYLDLDSDDDGISDVVEGGHSDPDNDNMVGTGMPIVNENGQATGNDSPTSNPTDTDGDGLFDFQELDSDDDGILDEFECPSDTPCADGDGDGIFDFQDIDRDNDGILDEYECETGAPCVDTDGDGIPDVDDLDSDNDTLSDTDECPNGAPCPDADGDEIDDFRDKDCIESTTPQIGELMGDGVYCLGDDIVLSATNTNPLEGDVMYTWTGPNDFEFVGTAASTGPFMVAIPAATVEANGTYSLILQSNEGCLSMQESVIVQVNGQPDTPIVTAEEPRLCAGESIQLNTTTYTGEVIYNWYYTEVNGDSLILIDMTEAPTLIIAETNVLNSGTYFVVATVDGCNSNISNEEQVVVLGTGEPITTGNNSSPGNPACVGETISFSATPLIEGTTYEWIGPNGFSSTLPTPSISDIGVENAGEYIVFVSQNGCPPVASFTTMVYIQSTVQPTIGGGGIICQGESISMEVTNDLEMEDGSTVVFNWFEATTNTIVATTTEPNLTIDNVTPAEAGAYYLGVTVNGCAASFSNEVTVELIDQTSEQAIIIKNSLRICEDQELPIEAFANANTTGRWSTTSTATIVSPNEAATTIFDIEQGESIFIWTLNTEECGDYSSDTLRVILEDLVIDAKLDVVEIEYETSLVDYDLLANDDLTEVGDDYTFSIIEEPARGELIADENGVITYVPQATFAGTVEFTYEICSTICPDVCDQANVKIKVVKLELSGECFIPNTFTPNEDGMNDAFTIECFETSNLNNKVMVFNRWGDKVFEKEKYRNDWKGTYNNKDLPPGTYFYIIKLDMELEGALQGYISLIR